MDQPSVKNIWMISREYGDIAGAGGVKDMVSQLAESLTRRDNTRVSVVLPCYGFITPRTHGMDYLPDPQRPGENLEFAVDMNYGQEERREHCRVWCKALPGLRLFLIEADRFLEKSSVYAYTEDDAKAAEWKKSGMGHYDYFAMNVLLQKSALELAIQLSERVDVLHCHDGHTALIPALINDCQGWRSYFRQTGCLVTIHNAGVGYHQEIADLPFAQTITGLSWQVIAANRLDGKFDPFLAAGEHAVLNTVSENYARELQETDEDLRTDWLGHTLLRRGVKIAGITNGISPMQLDPRNAKELGLTAPYDPRSPAEDLPGKGKCKQALLKLLDGAAGFDAIRQYGRLNNTPQKPLYTFIGRLNEQKGIDRFLAAVDSFFTSCDAQVVILGSGNELLENSVISLVETPRWMGRISYLQGYDPKLANILFSAGDFTVIPSRYEPCGLTDYIAQLFGNLPIVHHVGGLVKVIDGQTGFAYLGAGIEELTAALERAYETYKDTPLMRKMQRQAVATIDEKYSWDIVMEQYVGLYDKAKEMKIKI